MKGLGEDHPLVATSYNNLAAVYDAQGGFDEAIASYQKSLSIAIKCLGDEHPSVANTYNNLGAVYKAQGAFARAIELYEKALAIQVRARSTRLNLC